jgi:hypothetical protein
MTAQKKKHECRATQYSISREGEPIYSEGTIRIDIDDEGAGEFIVLTQEATSARGGVAIDPDEWPLVRKAIDKLVKRCR